MQSRHRPVESPLLQAEVVQLVVEESGAEGVLLAGGGRGVRVGGPEKECYVKLNKQEFYSIP